MIDLGNFSLIAAFALAVYGILAGFRGALKDDESWSRSARNAVLLCSVFSALSLGLLAWAFVSHDYRYAYVWQHSNNAMTPYYLVTAVWGGMDGSMLLWGVLMALYSGLAVWRTRGIVHPRLGRFVLPVFSGANSFFLGVTAFLTNPFRTIPNATGVMDGNGLNPLLQNPSMMIHPPSLYLGFTGLVVPFAFCIAALMSGELSNQWFQVTRRWTLIAWTFLTIGIILGGHWAYVELGWGGFWAWDPVENASFFPWLTATAFIHSIMVQEARGMLKTWNVSLSILTYFLSVFGTFLTRSGIVQSVHAFAATDFGWVFLVYLGGIFVLGAVLIIYRRKELRPESTIESWLSREAVFLFNNLLLLAVCFATIWGVMFPVISEWVTGEKSVVGPPFFNQVNVPLFLGLLFLMGVGPLMSWRRGSLRQLTRIFARPFLTGSVVFFFGLWIDPEHRLMPALGFGLSVFAIATVMVELHRAVRVRRQLATESYPSSVAQVIRRKPRRYGGFLVHLGVGVMALSITASMAFKVEKDFKLKAGEKFAVGRFVLALESLVDLSNPNYESLKAKVRVFAEDGTTTLGVLEPERRFYRKNEEATTEVDIRTTPREDLYLALAGLDVTPGSKESPDLTKTPAVFKVFINPLQAWLWLGAILTLIGSLVVIGPGLRSTALEPLQSPATAAESIA